MTDIATLRKRPEYTGLTDESIVDVLHQTHYRDMDRQVIADRLGVKPAEVEQPGAGIVRTAADMALKAGQGVVGLGQSAVGIADLATGGMAGKALDAVGYDPKRTNEMIGEFLSPQQKAADAAVQNAEGFTDTIGAAVTNPRAVAGMVAEAVPSMLGAGGAARAAAEKIFAKAAIGAGGAGTAAGEAAGKAAVEAAAGKLKWIASGGEGALTAGQIAEQARANDPTHPEKMYYGIPAGVATALVGRGMGAAFGDAETALLTGAKSAGATGGRFARTLKGVAGEGGEEALQSGQEQAFTNASQDRPLGEGVGNAMATGLVTGGAMGGGVSALTHQRVAGDGPLSRAANAGVDAANEAGGVPINPPDPALAAAEQKQQAADEARQAQSASAEQADAEQKSAAAQSTDLKQRAATMDAALSDPGLPNLIRQQTRTEANPAGDIEALLQAKHYAQAAMREDLPPDTRENFMALAERVLRDAMPQAMPEASIVPPSRLTNETGPAPLQIGYQSDPSGSIAVDSQGNAFPQSAAAAQAVAPTDTIAVDSSAVARPQTVAEQNAAQAALAERQTLGQQAPTGSDPSTTPVFPALRYDQSPTSTLVADQQGNVQPQTVAERANASQAAQRQVDLGMTPLRVSTTDIGLPDGSPLRNATAARIIQRKRGGEVIKVDGGYKVRVEQAADAIVTKGSDAKAAESKAGQATVDQGTRPATKGTGATSARATRRALEAAGIKAGDVPFSRGTTMRRGATKPASAARVAEVHQDSAALTRRWKNVPKVEVIASMDDAPEAVKNVDAGQKQQGATGSPRGFYHQGKVYLVASEMHGQVDILNTLAHEALGHAGLRGLFGDKLNGVLDRVAAGRPKDIATKAAQYGLDTSIEKSRRLAAEEVLAEMAETEPSNTWVRQAIAAVRSWLRSNVPGFGKMKLSDAEVIRSYLAPARDFVKKGAKVHHSALQTRSDVGRFDGPPVFSRSAGVSDAPKEKGSPAIPDWIKDGPAALKTAASKIDTYAPKKTLADRVKGWTKDWQLRLEQGIVDQFAPLKTLSMDAYISARMTKSAAGAFEGMLKYGKPKLDSDGALTGDVDGKGFIGVMKELQGDHDRFFMWMAGNRAEGLLKEGRENLFTANEIQAMKGLNQGVMLDGGSRTKAFAAAARDFKAYNDSILDIAERTGLIDGEARHLWANEFYIPFFRVDDDASISGPGKIKGLVRQKAFEKLKGGTENLGDLMENTLRNWSTMLSSSMANQAASKSLNAAAEAGAAVEAKGEQAQQMAKDAGVKGSATYYMDRGVQRWFVVEDPLVLSAISAMNPVGLDGFAMKVLASFKHYLTAGVTRSPFFKASNLIRDSIAAPATNEMSYNIAKNLTTGWAATDPKSEHYAQMLFGGAMTRFATSEADQARVLKRLLSEGVKDENVLNSHEKIKAFGSKLFEAYNEFGDRLENVNRASLYDQLKAGGMSHREASFNARDMMDFSMGGSWGAVRFLTAVVPFLNARIQGLAKLSKAAAANPKRFGYVTGAVSLASMALMLINKDDEDWKRRKDWDRDNYWWFKFSGEEFRIPKPFEIGALGTLAERSLELLVDDEMTGKRFGERIKQMVLGTFAMNPVPQAFKPVIDLYANKDSFTGATIETPSLEKLSKSERAGPNTSAVAKVLGAAGDYTNLSPVQIDHLIRAYFGWTGVFAAATVDAVVGVMSDTQKPSKRIEDYMGGFVRALPSNQSRYVDELYDQAKAYSEILADIKHARATGDAERAKSIEADNPGIQAKAKTYTGAEQQIGKISTEIKRVQSDRSMSGDDKRNRIDALNQQRNQIAERVRRATP